MWACTPAHGRLGPGSGSGSDSDGNGGSDSDSDSEFDSCSDSGSASYSVIDMGTNESVVPFSAYTTMSCDTTSNYFKQDLNAFEPNRAYKILVKVNQVCTSLFCAWLVSSI